MPNNLYAVIVGINNYSFKPLSGCINDALAVQDYFRGLCGDRFIPKFLLAPSSEADAEIGKREITAFDAPTRANIIQAFDHFTKAGDGDVCVFYYSGHGSTASAPDIFLGYQPGDVLQTLVGVDSRVNDAPDILDKEIGYLIAKALENKGPAEGKKGIHFLTIIDSCHSGTVTRGDGDNAPVARMARRGFPPAEVTGFDKKGNCYYAPFAPGQTTVDPNGGLKPARHISLAGARNSESAYELYFSMPDKNFRKYGAFTWSLLEILRQNGPDLTYAELIRQAESVVRARIDNQIPRLTTTEKEDDYLLFLHNEFQAPEAVFPVVFDQLKARWILKAGEINGVSGPGAVVKIGDREVKILSVEPSVSILDYTAFQPEERNAVNLKATLPVVTGTIKIGLSAQLTATMKSDVGTAFQKQQLRYATLIGSDGQPEYIVDTMPDNEGNSCFVLIRPGSKTPLFMRTPDARRFVGDVAKFARYTHVLSMNNPKTKIPKNAVSITVKTLEGVAFDAGNLDTVAEEKYNTVPNQSTVPYPELIHVSGVNIGKKVQQPAIRVRVKADGNSYWVGVLYCDAKFGIADTFLPAQKIGGAKENPYADLKFMTNGREYLSIPLQIDKNWQSVGVTEIDDYLLVFVSAQSFDLSQYRQKGVELDTMRDPGFDDDNVVVQKDDWRVIKIPVRISIPKAKQTLRDTLPADFGAFSLQMPAGFTGTVETVNRASILQDKSAAYSLLLPPGNLWDGVEGAPEVFTRGISGAPDTHLSMIELTDYQGAVDPDKPIVVFPRDPLGEEEAIIPYGYDKESGLYFSLGYTDENGRVRIERLPEETPGRLGQDAKGQRSLSGSIKLFFQKTVWSRITGRKRFNRLSLAALDENGMLQRISYFGGKGEKDRESLTEIQNQVKSGSVLLILHGIIGDTDNSAPALLRRPEIAGKFKAVLAFDYENLDSEIEDIARELLSMLHTCGVPEKSVTIVAHSMGGLVCRWMIEREGGDRLVKQLIQVATPNSGSEIGDFRKKLTGWIALGINGFTIVNPYLAFCSLLWKGLENNLFRTLNQMEPDSPFLQRLNGIDADRKDVVYHLITGDTSIIESSAGEDETVWRQVLTGLKERGKYILADFALFDGVPNDMAVKVERARSLKGGFAHEKVVACDHASYFMSKAVLDGIENLLR